MEWIKIYYNSTVMRAGKGKWASNQKKFGFFVEGELTVAALITQGNSPAFLFHQSNLIPINKRNLLMDELVDWKKERAAVSAELAAFGGLVWLFCSRRGLWAGWPANAPQREKTSPNKQTTNKARKGRERAQLNEGKSINGINEIDEMFDCRCFIQQAGPAIHKPTKQFKLILIWFAFVVDELGWVVLSL